MIDSLLKFLLRTLNLLGSPLAKKILILGGDYFHTDATFSFFRIIIVKAHYGKVPKNHEKRLSRTDKMTIFRKNDDFSSTLH